MTVPDIFLGSVEADGLIVGTNNADDVPVGTTFTRLVKIRVEGDPGAATATELWSKPISLRLVEVLIFRKSVALVPRGWSAGLRLEGVGIEAITDALGGKERREFLHLRTSDEA